MNLRIAPSILSADFGTLAAEVQDVSQGGAEWIHVDVMDGRFVPPITIGDGITAAVRKATTLPVDVHLMIEQPERQLQAFRQAGADRITVHAEACPHLHRVLGQIRELGASPGVAINPSTPLTAVEEVLDACDLVLIMTVNPGWGGQKTIPSCVEKLDRLRAWIEDMESPPLLQVDGGVHPKNAHLFAAADVLVAGSAVFGNKNRKGAMEAIREGWRKGAAKKGGKQ